MTPMEGIDDGRAHEPPVSPQTATHQPAKHQHQTDAPAAQAPCRPVDLGWSQAMDVAKRDDQTSSKYVRLVNDGDQITLMMRQVPYGYFAHRLGENGRFAGWERCAGSTCAHCTRGSRESGRYLIDVLDVEARARRLWEPSKTTFKALEAVARRFPPHVHTYEITRHGRAGDQGTRYQLLPAGSVTPELRTLSDKLPLFDLEAESWGESRRPDDDTSPAPLPF